MPLSTRKLSVIASVLTALLLLLRYHRGPSEEERIRAVFSELTQQATFEGEIHPLELIKEVRRFGLAFHPEVRLIAHYDGETHQVDGREKLLEYVAGARKRLAQAASSVEDLKIQVTGDEAEVNGHGSLMGRVPGRDDYFLEQHRFRAALVNVDDHWTIKEAENIPGQ